MPDRRPMVHSLRTLDPSQERRGRRSVRVRPAFVAALLACLVAVVPLLVVGYPAALGRSTVNVGPSDGLPVAGLVQHVVVIVLENQEISTVYTSAPYERYLQHTFGNATTFYGACHDSLPEYAAMTSGRSYTCTSIPIEGVTNLADLAQAKGESWDGYFEGMTSPCQLASGGSYVSYHNPFILYKDIRYNSTRCDAHILNSASFNSSLANGTLPTLSYYVPNIYDDGLHSSVAAADTWLRSFLSPILNSTSPVVLAEVATTAFFIVSDEGSSTDLSGYSAGGVVSSWCQNQTQTALSVCGGHTYLSVVSPLSHGNTYTADATDYNLESTVEWLLGLGNDGGNDGTTAFPAMTTLFV